MTNQQLRLKWPELKKKIEEEYPNFSLKDLVYKIGQEEELLLRLQKKMNKTRKQIDNWLSLLG